MNAKRFLAGSVAVTMALGISACGKGGSESNKDESSFVEKVSLPDEENESKDLISDFPEGAQTELEWFSYYDLNPSRSQPEKSTNLALFEQKGGSIKYSRTSSGKKYDDLAARLMSNDPPDMFAYEQKMTFPANCIKQMFQPVDDVIDFDSPLWTDVKDTADQFTLDGKHYVAPIAFGALSVMTYNKAEIEANGLEDPYELYQNGEWDWDTWYELMKEYCEGAEADSDRFGINGWFAPFIFQSTGKTLIKYDAETDEYVANLFDPDLERAADLLYNIEKEGMYYSEWVGSARDAFKKNILFYAMGTWAVTPEEGDEWGIVPMPKDPNSDTLYTTLEVNAYMWVKGSTAGDAYRIWNECSRVTATDQEYLDVGREKFFVNKPYFTEEMYDVAYSDVTSEKFVRLIDPGYGISTALSDDDAATNPSKEAIIPFMYSSVMKSDENGKQYTWAALRETYKATIDSELKTFNDEYHKFIGK